MYQELAMVTKVEARAWLIAVGRRRVTPSSIKRWDRVEAQHLLAAASRLALTYTRRGSIRPYEIVDLLNPRPGLRRWVAVRSRSVGDTAWLEARVSAHLDGAVSVAFALGGLPSDHNAFHPAWEFDSSAVEGAVADFMGLVRAGGLGLGSTDYEVRVGIERGGPERMIMHTLNNFGHRYSDASTPHALVRASRSHRGSRRQ
jgi:hypothetical protein